MVTKMMAQELAALRQAYRDLTRWLESALKMSGEWERAISWMRIVMSKNSMSKVSGSDVSVVQWPSEKNIGFQWGKFDLLLSANPLGMLDLKE
jgi:hypothetical protein